MASGQVIHGLYGRAFLGLRDAGAPQEPASVCRAAVDGIE